MKKEQIQNRLDRTVINLVTVCLILMIWQGNVTAQDEAFSVMFYNVENLFDTIDSPLGDDEFLPYGTRHWGSWRYNSKINSIYKVIVSVNEWSIPRVIGLCEVENQSVVDDLVKNTYLSRHAYRAYYEGGNDERGIGIAMLVDTSFFSVLEIKSSNPVTTDGRYISTRPVMRARLANNEDSITVIITHWPSRRGGATATEVLRERVAGLIAEEVRSSISSYGPGEKIIIMGDLNCEPASEIVTGTLGALSPAGTISETGLYNLSSAVSLSEPGSYKYQGIWLMYDQVIVSGSLLMPGNGYHVMQGGFSVYNDKMILVPDSRYNGFKPFSTWTGPVYNGGYSDHLPVICMFELISPPSRQE